MDLGGPGFLHRLFLDAGIGVQIDLRRLHRFMAEPKRNLNATRSLFQQGHGGAVPQAVRGDLLAPERGAVLASCAAMSGDDAVDSVAAERAAAITRKQGPIGVVGQFADPALEHLSP